VPTFSKNYELNATKCYGLIILFLILLVFTIFLYFLLWQNSKKKLTFAMLDVGQGDALFIESPTGTQILIDSGPSRKILGQLARLMPPFDRHLDAIIITNPDRDHIGGFLEILKNYKVDKIFESGTFNKSKIYKNLKKEIEKQNIQDILAKKGMVLNIGDGAVIEILFPDQDVSTWSPNEGSIVAQLTYGKNSVMLMGDATLKTEEIIIKHLVAKLSSDLAVEPPSGELGGSTSKFTNNCVLVIIITCKNNYVNILKIGHHGSRTSTSEKLIEKILPNYAFISSGKNNKYNHPHPEILNTLNKFGTKIFRTDLLGSIIMKSNGQNSVFSFGK
jgi:competence protein ComEC